LSLISWNILHNLKFSDTTRGVDSLLIICCLDFTNSMWNNLTSKFVTFDLFKNLALIYLLYELLTLGVKY